MSVSQTLANYRLGRVALHIAAAALDHAFAFHWNGVKREFTF